MDSLNKKEGYNDYSVKKTWSDFKCLATTKNKSFSFATSVLCDYILILTIIHCPISVYMHMYSYDYASCNLLENWIILKHWSIFLTKY